ncbi:MAG: single-stranded-DNA-specific exonuclease RecJ [Selenomonadaceae bacterium]
MEKKWCVREHDVAAEKKLADAIGVPQVIAGILMSRGIDTVDEAQKFLMPETEPYHDPFLMKDMDKAVKRIIEAIEGKERFVIYGDYDVDGITATTILMRFFEHIGAGDYVSYFIPTRKIGYGLHTEPLMKIADAGASLVVTVDCGISSADIVESVRDRLDIVVTDHHLPGDDMPKAVAVVDPHQKDCKYPFKDLCGAGVAFKLCQALSKQLYNEEYAYDLELAALGTIADLVPLLGENRKIVKAGLKAINENPERILGLHELIDVSGLSGKSVTSGQVGFVIAPRLNAAGRLETASIGTELLLSSDKEKARELAAELDGANEERKRIELDILAQAEEQIKKRYEDPSQAKVIVAYGDDWHAGVIGLVSSRITEKYYRPSVVIGIHDGVGKGSCRSIEGFHMFDALTSAKDSLIQFGGHSMAAGITIKPEKIDELEEKLNAFADAHLTPEQMIPVLSGEAELSPLNVSTDFVDTLSKLEPYGMGNPRPIFIAHESVADGARLVGREDKRHLMFNVGNVHAIGWNMAEKLSFATGGPIDIAYMPEIDEWNGNRYVQIKLQDVREAVSRRIFPNREILANVYIAIRELSGAVTKTQAGIAAVSELQLSTRLNYSLYTLRKCLDIFMELGLIKKDNDEYRMLPRPKEKLDLNASKTFTQGK